MLVMSSQICPNCKSTNRREFPAEINIHLTGVGSLTKPTVWIFPRLSVCLDCGVAQFSVTDAELDRLSERDTGGQAYKAAG